MVPWILALLGVVGVLVLLYCLLRSRKPPPSLEEEIKEAFRSQESERIVRTMEKAIEKIEAADHE